MPVVNHSSYNSPIWLRNGHLQTIWPVLFRNPPLPSLWRERLETPDGDFIDIDHIPACAGIRSGRVAILSHGLEGNSTRRYMLGMAEALNRRGWDVVARNFRGCSGEMNHTLPLYHGGETDDLHLVVQYCVSLGYGSIVLVGFSMGGNQTLKYLGERDRTIPSQVSAAVAVSVPCDMEGAAEVPFAALPGSVHGLFPADAAAEGRRKTFPLSRSHRYRRARPHPYVQRIRRSLYRPAARLRFRTPLLAGKRLPAVSGAY